MYTTLHKAKQILASLIELLGMGDDNDEDIGDVLGKRQRVS
jgi:hypothetical protein